MARGCPQAAGGGVIGKTRFVPSRGESTSVTYRAVAVLAWLPTACAGDPNPRLLAEVDTLGGVVVVRNGPVGLWRESEQWQVVEEFRVGNVWGGGDEELTTPRNNSVTLGPNGQIFVLEYSTGRVVAFSGEGELVRSFGGPGEGPGDLRHPMAMTWDQTGRLWVAADLHGRYHVFDSTGVFQKSVPRPVRSVNRIQHPLLWEETGTLVDETITRTGPEVVLFLRVDTLGQVVDTMSLLPKARRFRSGRMPMMIRPGQEAFRFLGTHYLASTRWSLAPDGTVWSATTGRLRLVQTDSSGDTLRIVETSHRPESFDRRDEEAISEGLAEAGVSRQDVELVRPLVNDIYVMDDGHMLVGIIEQVGEDPSIFDVFDPEGYFLGSVDLGFTIPHRNIPALVGDTIVAVTPGLLDVPFLVRVTIVRP